jgi:GR25 family glycosyltransferase involved in LPS biosynthesis
MLLKSFPIFCINLDRNEDRWEKIQKQFSNLNQEVIRFPASDGKYLTDGDLPLLWGKIDREYRTHGINKALSNLEFKPGVVGCALSHYRLWKFAVKHNIEFFCVLEDDANVIKNIKNIECPDDFDILYISGRIKGNDKNYAVDGVGTEGYILSLNGAKKLIKVCEDLLGPIDYRIQSHIRGFIQESVQNRECLLFHSFKNRDIIIEGYKTLENYVSHNSNESQIDKKYEEDLNNKLITKFKTKKNVVFIPFNNEVNIIFDKRPNFITVVMCFSHEKPVPKFPYLVDYFCAVQTECKGDLMQYQIEILNNIIKDYNFVAMYDDDIKIKVSEIEKLFEIAQEKKLDLFAPSLSSDSYHTYDVTLNKGSGIRLVKWVEIMMPHFSRRFIEQFKLHLKNLSQYNFKTSYGFDLFLFPEILEEIRGNCAIVDDIIAKHNREITSDKKTFSNGLTALQEMKLVENYVNNYKDYKRNRNYWWG